MFISAYTKYNCNSVQFKLLSELCMFYAHEQSHNSFKLFNFIIEKCHPNLVEKEIFKMKEKNPYFPIFTGKIDLLFNGDTGDDFKKNLLDSLQKYHQNLLKIESNGNLSNELNQTFYVPLSFDGYTCNVLVSQTPVKFDEGSKENPFNIVEDQPKKKDKKKDKEKEKDKDKFSTTNTGESDPNSDLPVVELVINKPLADPTKPLSPN